MTTAPSDLDFEVDFDIDDTDPHNLFTSPDKKHAKKPSSGANGAPIEPLEDIRGRAKDRESRQTEEEGREAALRQELENIRKINEVLEGVHSSLEKAKNNMETVSRTVTNASTLLQTWTRILSQTEHNQRLILNPAWQGATQDLADVENEEQRKQQEAARRQIEEQQRREAATRKAEEDARKAEAAAKASSRGSRGRGRAVTRAGASNSGRTTPSGYVAVGGQRGVGRGSTNSSNRGTSGIGKGLRGRARGLG